MPADQPLEMAAPQDIIEQEVEPLHAPVGIAFVDDDRLAGQDRSGEPRAHGPEARAADILARDGAAPFLAAARGRLELAAPLSVQPHCETIGLHLLIDGCCAMAVGLPFGQAHALDVIALVAFDFATSSGRRRD